MQSARDGVGYDPSVPEWLHMELPDTWPDRLNLLRPQDWLRLARALFGRPGRPEIPSNLPGREKLPKYLVHEFHGLPNGNFSKRITRGYITGFDHVMLGRMRLARQNIVAVMKGCRSVLDVGCGGGQTAALLHAAGIVDVWGIDPSPYLLQHAARAYPHIRFVQGLAEELEFVDQRFDGVVACFVMHEMPPRVAAQALSEFHRVLRPGGCLTVCEPAAEQLQKSYAQLWNRYGFTGVYFRFLAQRVHEPFVAAWHKQDAVALLNAAGFDLLEDRTEMPVRHLVARKR
ncbi:MAG TPA: class I SAM-dependent methyltransferase [Steroidobacteraceae bacterium]|nr:class I SAM-dependent methyltransferase [Steroidobacteraceae bacterium]